MCFQQLAFYKFYLTCRISIYVVTNKGFSSTIIFVSHVQLYCIMHMYMVYYEGICGYTDPTWPQVFDRLLASENVVTSYVIITVMVDGQRDYYSHLDHTNAVLYNLSSVYVEHSETSARSERCSPCCHSVLQGGSNTRARCYNCIGFQSASASTARLPHLLTSSEL